MLCSNCYHTTMVVDSRTSEYKVRRRRECTNCGLRVTTIEKVLVKSPMVIIEGRKYRWDRQILIGSLMMALHSFDIGVDKLDELVYNIEIQAGFYQLLEREQLVEIVGSELKKIDEKVYRRYKVVYDEI